MFSFIRRNFAECAAGILVLMIVASVFTPAISRAPDGARRISCVNNLKQIGTALMQYTNEYDETYPRLANGTTADGKAFTWRLATRPYLQDVETWKCPSNEARKLESSTDGLPLSYEVVDCGPIRSGKP